MPARRSWRRRRQSLKADCRRRRKSATVGSRAFPLQPMTAAVPAARSPLRLTAKASALARKGHPWFFRDDLQRDPGPPAIVRVHDDAGRDLGLGFTSRGKLALRLCGPWLAGGASAGDDAVPDRETFFGERLRAALE